MPYHGSMSWTAARPAVQVTASAGRCCAGVAVPSARLASCSNAAWVGCTPSSSLTCHQSSPSARASRMTLWCRAPAWTRAALAVACFQSAARPPWRPCRRQPRWRLRAGRGMSRRRRRRRAASSSWLPLVAGWIGGLGTAAVGCWRGCGVAQGEAAVHVQPDLAVGGDIHSEQRGQAAQVVPTSTHIRPGTGSGVPCH